MERLRIQGPLALVTAVLLRILDDVSKVFQLLRSPPHSSRPSTSDLPGVLIISEDFTVILTTVKDLPKILTVLLKNLPKILINFTVLPKILIDSEVITVILFGFEDLPSPHRL